MNPQKTFTASFCILIALLALTGCEAPAKSDAFPEALTQVFDAHGGYAQWQQVKSISYTLADGTQEWIGMPERRILVKAADKSFGFDGQQLWVTPASADDAGIRFRHSLFFYFFSMPFVLGDPGIRYTAAGSREIMGQTYEGLKISFDNGVGDASNDNYILWYDPATGLMHWLMYTSTFGTDAPKENYNLIHFADWETVNGLRVPLTLQWHEFDQQQAGAVTGEVRRSAVDLSAYPASAGFFAMPAGGRVVQ